LTTISRSTAIIWLLAGGAILAGVLVFRHGVLRPGETAPPSITNPADALAALRRGNERFVKSARTLSTDTAHDAELRQATAQGQHPFAAILCCSDSRVCPEFIFDQPEGSFFEVRNAGNVTDDDVLGSLEYAVEHLHVPLMLVLGHTRCGAVSAVYDAHDTPLHDHLSALQQHMPCVRSYAHEHQEAADALTLKALSRDNAKEQSELLLKDSPLLKHAIRRGSTRLVYGLYDIETGVVEFYDL